MDTLNKLIEEHDKKVEEVKKKPSPSPRVEFVEGFDTVVVPLKEKVITIIPKHFVIRIPIRNS